VFVCLLASANYVINEWLDAEFDKFHPLKKFRPSVTQKLSPTIIYTIYGTLIFIGLFLASRISSNFLYFGFFFIFMAFLYNVKPFRTKDRVYLDVMSESINNPIRFCLGWFILDVAGFPPSSVLISYWMGGAFLMGAKRFAEYRFINNPELAGQYRLSFKKYNEQKLLISVVFYAILSSFFLGAFLIKHRIELIISFIFLAFYFAWYLHIAFKEDSSVQRPESFFKERNFMAYTVFLALLFLVLFFVDMPGLQFLLD
jgi:decaprenyl-phosphate phosphoribosyltransferase